MVILVTVRVTAMSPQWLMSHGCTQRIGPVGWEATNSNEDDQQVAGEHTRHLFPIYPIVWFFQQSLVLKLLWEGSTQDSVNPLASSRCTHAPRYTQPTVSPNRAGAIFPKPSSMLSTGSEFTTCLWKEGRQSFWLSFWLSSPFLPVQSWGWSWVSRMCLELNNPPTKSSESFIVHAYVCWRTNQCTHVHPHKHNEGYPEAFPTNRANTDSLHLEGLSSSETSLTLYHDIFLMTLGLSSWHGHYSRVTYFWILSLFLTKLLTVIIT